MGECQSRFVDDSKTYKKYSLDEKSCVDKTHNEDEDCAENDPKRTVNWGLSIGEKDKLVTQVNVGLPLRYLIKLGETGSIIAKTSILHQVLKLKDISEAIGSYLSDTYLGQKKTASNENGLMTAQGWTIAVFHIFIVDAVRRTRKWKEDAMDEDESGKADPGERKRKLLDEALKNFKDLKNDFYEVEAPDSDFPDPAFCIDKGANFISQTIDEDEELKELKEKKTKKYKDLRKGETDEFEINLSLWKNGDKMATRNLMNIIILLSDKRDKSDFEHDWYPKGSLNDAYDMIFGFAAGEKWFAESPEEDPEYFEKGYTWWRVYRPEFLDAKVKDYYSKLEEVCSTPWRNSPDGEHRDELWRKCMLKADRCGLHAFYRLKRYRAYGIAEVICNTWKKSDPQNLSEFFDKSQISFEDVFGSGDGTARCKRLLTAVYYTSMGSKIRDPTLKTGVVLPTYHFSRTMNSVGMYQNEEGQNEE